MAGQAEGCEYQDWIEIAVKVCGLVTGSPLAGKPVSVEADKVPAAQVLMFHFGRGFRTFTALGLLLREGYTQDAVVLTRVLLEVLFEMAFIAKHPDQAAQYLEYGKQMERQWQNQARDYLPDVLIQSMLPEAKPSDPPARKKPRSSWHSKFTSVRQRGIEGGIAPIYYDLFYSFASRYIHGSGDWLRELTKPVPGGIHVSYTSDSTERNLVMMIACGCLIEMLYMLDGCLELYIRSHLDPVRQEYDALVAKRAASILDKHTTASA